METNDEPRITQRELLDALRTLGFDVVAKRLGTSVTALSLCCRRNKIPMGPNAPPLVTNAPIDREWLRRDLIEPLSPTPKLMQPGPGEFNIWASKKHKQTAMTIMRILVDECQRRQWTIERGVATVRFRRPTTVITANGHVFAVSLRELLVKRRLLFRLGLTAIADGRVRQWSFEPTKESAAPMVAYIEKVIQDASRPRSLRKDA